jgi:regulator of sigma E protease
MDPILNTLSYVLWVALALGILVFVHELGHFLAARLFGMRVDAFSIGFPPNVVSRRVGQTEYRVGAVPLGGYVKIAGMVDESLDTEGMESEPAPDEYRSKPVWQRIVVITAGVVFNLILAFAIWSVLAFAYGERYTPAERARLEVQEGTIASEIGLETGDRIVAVNGEEIERFLDVFEPGALAADPLRLTVLRDGQRVELEGPEGLMTRFARQQRELDQAGEAVTLQSVFGADIQRPAVLTLVQPGSPADAAGLRAGDRILAVDGGPVTTWGRFTEAIAASEGRALTIRWARPDSLATDAADGAARVVERRGAATVYEAEAAPRPAGDDYRLGVGSDASVLGTRTRELGPGEAVAAGFDRTVSNTTAYFQFVGLLVSGRESVRENVGGPLMIAKASKEAADRGLRSFWEFVAFLSIALAVFNILPIPALDGGHLVFLVYEGVVRREPSLKVRLVVQQVGVALILALMVFVIFNDAVRWFG